MIAPRAVRPNSEYHVSISVQEVLEPITVNVILLGVSYSGKPYSTQETVFFEAIQPHSTKIARLEVKCHCKKNYYKILLTKKNINKVKFCRNKPFQTFGPFMHSLLSSCIIHQEYKHIIHFYNNPKLIAEVIRR